MVSRKGYTQKKRRGRYRQTKKILLLAVEGKNKTESNYFQSVASPYVDVRIVRGNETDPVGMAKRMLYEYEGNLQDSDYAACLVDSDFDVQKDAQLREADHLIEQARNKNHQNVHLIQSSPCFEIGTSATLPIRRAVMQRRQMSWRSWKSTFRAIRRGRSDCLCRD